MLNIIKQQVNVSPLELLDNREKIVEELTERAVSHDVNFNKTLVVSYDVYMIDEKTIVELVFAGRFNGQEISRIASLLNYILMCDFEYDTWGFNYC